MMPKTSSPSEWPSLAAQVVPPADQFYRELARALIRANFLFAYHPERTYNAYDLNLAQVDVLAVLADAGEASLTCSEIAEKTLITKGGITGILDRLEARGFIKRMPSRDDRRRVLVRLSAKGIEFFRKFYPELAHNNRELFEKAFRPDQLKEFSKLLNVLIRSLEAE
ncbi:MAG TPA: MarR family transcriptional regulator [Candidatus Binataceae bacterium]|nr:MarR family transcriptional regulator [Candidatus Binataceae bacterium]